MDADGGMSGRALVYFLSTDSMNILFRNARKSNWGRAVNVVVGQKKELTHYTYEVKWLQALMLLLLAWKFLRNMYTSWLENERNNLGNIFGIKEFSPKSSFCLHLFQTLVLSILLLFFLEYPSTFIQHWVMHLCPVRIHMCRKENHHQRMFSWWKNALSVLFMSSVTQKKNC